MLKMLATLISTIGPTGLKALPVRALLVLPQAKTILPQGVFGSLEALPETATVGDIPSDTWLEAISSMAVTFAEQSSKSIISDITVNSDDEGHLIVCRSCKETHFYDVSQA